jgi:phosphoglycerol transferase MdoB-like AlkP superfamily enzyme
MKYINLNVGFLSSTGISSDLFSFAWIFVFILIMSCLKLKYRKIYLFGLLIIFYIVSIVNCMYLTLFNNFFSFKNIVLVNEGANYFNIVFSFINIKLIMIIFISILLTAIGIKFMLKNNNDKRDRPLILTLIILFLSFYIGAQYKLGGSVSELSWDAWQNKRNIYNTFSITRESFKISGLYEYTFRDIYLSYIYKKKINYDQTIEYLDNYFKQDNTQMIHNQLSGLFKNKNLILVMMESIDNWLVTETTMPTVYKMMNEGVNFTNHYTPIYGGGSTFNSEFMANTGLMTPFNENIASYTYVNNNFYYSLPNLLKREGYNVNAFHFNTSDFYNRKNMYKAFGYDNLYSSIELGIPEPEGMLDSHFITNEKMSKLIIPDNKFMSFIITYTAHVPYTSTGTQCSQLLSKAINDKDMEMTCLKLQAGETDRFFQLLLEKLKSENKLDNTVIVAYADHYVYGLSNREKLYELKGTRDDNLVNKTPFFIWSNNIEPLLIKKVTSNIDILPTIAELFGLNYNPKYYLGINALIDDNNGFVFFNDYSWYDGNIYYNSNEVLTDDVDMQYIKMRNKKIRDLLKLNSSILGTNYFDKHNN